jgi:hypothetical protein
MCSRECYNTVCAYGCTALDAYEEKKTGSTCHTVKVLADTTNYTGADSAALVHYSQPQYAGSSEGREYMIVYADSAKPAYYHSIGK